MQYIHVSWVHDYVDEPVELLSEVDGDGDEVRRVQIFRDGRLEWADGLGGTDVGGLSEVPIDLEEIRRQPGEFLLTVIDRQRFEQEWGRAGGRR
ncbi:DUF6881 domain-containing protein [Actinoplanes friuliensis]|uniref:DUF6881 domain-containing protein n=1 Tax=Actinoplanes friuliensis DSM 7358 TaxID=1246995 RepID=U5VX49_9ACTN|nr:hypothetical protein AFR_15835 [Actinoplanes friuliensis DSM 7358]